MYIADHRPLMMVMMFMMKGVSPDLKELEMRRKYPKVV